LSLSVWRIGTTKALRLEQLDLGSTLAPGRWHQTPPAGRPVVYAGESRALCQLEKRVHCNGIRPVNQALLRLDLPNGAILEDVRGLADLPSDWIDRESLTQSIGIEWRRTNRALGLWVPSAVEPGENNIVLNPDHTSFASIMVTVERNPFSFDDRMFS
jgi:RES domain-containing protein